MREVQPRPAAVVPHSSWARRGQQQSVPRALPPRVPQALGRIGGGPWEIPRPICSPTSTQGREGGRLPKQPWISRRRSRASYPGCWCLCHMARSVPTIPGTPDPVQSDLHLKWCMIIKFERTSDGSLMMQGHAD